MVLGEVERSGYGARPAHCRDVAGPAGGGWDSRAPTPWRYDSFLGVSPIPCRVLVPEDLRAKGMGSPCRDSLPPDELGPVE